MNYTSKLTSCKLALSNKECNNFSGLLHSKGQEEFFFETSTSLFQLISCRTKNILFSVCSRYLVVPVVPRVNAIHRMNRYPLDKC